nr:hypothetical transcript [Hymenolepis microstoma]
MSGTRDEKLDKIIRRKLESVKSRYGKRRLDPFPRRNLRFDEMNFRVTSRSPLGERNTQEERLIKTFDYYRKLAVKYNSKAMSNITTPMWCIEEQIPATSRDSQSALNNSDENEPGIRFAEGLSDEFDQRLQI